MQQNKLKPSVITFSTLIDGHLKSGDLEKALKTFNIMIEQE